MKSRSIRILRSTDFAPLPWQFHSNCYPHPSWSSASALQLESMECWSWTSCAAWAILLPCRHSSPVRRVSALQSPKRRTALALASSADLRCLSGAVCADCRTRLAVAAGAAVAEAVVERARRRSKDLASAGKAEERLAWCVGNSPEGLRTFACAEVPCLEGACTTCDREGRWSCAQ